MSIKLHKAWSCICVFFKWFSTQIVKTWPIPGTDSEWALRTHDTELILEVLLGRQVHLEWGNTVGSLFKLNDHIDGLVRDCSNSIVNAPELLQSCTKPLILRMKLLYQNSFGHILMAWCKKDVAPLLTHWSYIFLALNHPYKSIIITCSNMTEHCLQHSKDQSKPYISESHLIAHPHFYSFYSTI